MFVDFAQESWGDRQEMPQERAKVAAGKVERAGRLGISNLNFNVISGSFV
jgi:hypothetical protein